MMQLSRTVNIQTHCTKDLTSQSPTYQKCYTGCSDLKSAIKLFTFTF